MRERKKSRKLSKGKHEYSSRRLRYAITHTALYLGSTRVHVVYHGRFDAFTEDCKRERGHITF